MSAVGRSPRNGANVAFHPRILISTDDYTWYIRIGEEDARRWGGIREEVVFDREIEVGRSRSREEGVRHIFCEISEILYGQWMVGCREIRLGMGILLILRSTGDPTGVVSPRSHE